MKQIQRKLLWGSSITTQENGKVVFMAKEELPGQPYIAFSYDEIQGRLETGDFPRSSSCIAEPVNRL